MNEYLDTKTTKELIASLSKYNKAKTAEEGFGALNSLINNGLIIMAKELNIDDKDVVKEESL